MARGGASFSRHPGASRSPSSKGAARTWTRFGPWPRPRLVPRIRPRHGPWPWPGRHGPRSWPKPKHESRIQPKRTRPPQSTQRRPPHSYSSCLRYPDSCPEPPTPSPASEAQKQKDAWDAKYGTFLQRSLYHPEPGSRGDWWWNTMTLNELGS